MAIYTPALRPVVYTGELPRKLWEVRARKVPILKNGDIVIIPELTAVLLVKKNGFSFFDGELSITHGTQNSEDGTTKSEDGTTKSEDEIGEYSLPNVSDIDTLTRDELITALMFVGVKGGNKKDETLKELLLGYLPKQEENDIEN